MEIHLDAVVPFPREVVWTTYRDRTRDLLPFLPNIRAIEKKARVEGDGFVEIEHEWHGGADIPAVVRSVLSESMLRWTDYATFRDATHEVEWRTRVHAFPDAVSSSGKNRFVANGDSTTIEYRGHIKVDGAKVKGVPRLLAGTVSETAEKMIVASVHTNLLATAKGVTSLVRETLAG